MMKIKKYFKKEHGFTLVELLAVMGVVVVIGAVTSAIILSTLRAANKANELNIVRQNGNFAILQTSRTIQYAKSFDGVSTGETDENGNLIFTNDCTGDSQASPSPSPSSGPSLTRYSSIRVTLFDESSVTFSCTPPAVPEDFSETIDGSTTDLIDTNSVSVSDCYFTCSQNFITDSPAIGINLVLSQASGNTSFTDQTATVPFNTTITMRNSNK